MGKISSIQHLEGTVFMHVQHTDAAQWSVYYETHVKGITLPQK